MSESSQTQKHSYITLTMSRTAFWLWMILMLAPWGMLTLALGPQWIRQCVQGWKAWRTERGDKRLFYCSPGPWGNLEYTRIVIEPPEAFTALSFDPEKKEHWVLHGYTPQMLAQLWTEANLSAADQQILMATARWENGIGTVVIDPPRELILRLSPNARAHIYKALSEFPENHAVQHPFRFRADRIDEWFADSNITPRTEQLIRCMLYSRGGNSLLFSDLDTLLPLLGTAKERARALKTLSRISTLLVKLRVLPNTDVEVVARYWGRGRRSKDIAPLLASLPKRPEGYTIDVVHLLPPFARRRLYTYPNPECDSNTPRQDCHWTSMNFFSESPDNQFLSPDNTRAVIMKDYYPVLGDPLFGDIVFLMKPNGEAIHSCVYVADNIVFTKNGSQPYVPWLLMELSDVRALYSMDSPLETRIFRYKHW